jgi:HAMP domain-containing protein
VDLYSEYRKALVKLLARFNLIFMALFAIGTALAIWLASIYLQKDTKDQVLAQAKLMMLTTSATRSYTSEQIQPLLGRMQKRDATFLPQTVPNYAATQVFNYLHASEPAYAYKEATLNPTNLVDRASDWEADVVNAFRNDNSLQETSAERDTPNGRSLFYARPIRVTRPDCLECHSTPNRAPAAMLRQYGRSNGFGWNLNEVVGAQIVSVPESLPAEIARRQLKSLVVYLLIIALAALIVLDAVLIVAVIRPVAMLSRAAEDLSQGKVSALDIPAKGRDEISALAASFNRMQCSLAKALKLLEKDGSL